MDKLIESGAIVIGGVMNRFKNDAAIRAYCDVHGFINASVTDNGEVWAEYILDQDEVQIGWTF